MTREHTLQTAETLAAAYLEVLRSLLSWDEIKRLFRAAVAERLNTEVEDRHISKSALARQLGISRPTLDFLLDSNDEKPTVDIPPTNFPALIFLLLQRSRDKGMTLEELRRAYHRFHSEVCEYAPLPDTLHPQEGNFGEVLKQLVHQGRVYVENQRYWTIEVETLEKTIFLLLQRGGEYGMTLEALRCAYEAHYLEACEHRPVLQFLRLKLDSLRGALDRLVLSGDVAKRGGRYLTLSSALDRIPAQENMPNLQTKLQSFMSIALDICSALKKQENSESVIRRRVLNVVDDVAFTREMFADFEAKLYAFCDEWEQRSREHARALEEPRHTVHVFVVASGTGPKHVPE